MELITGNDFITSVCGKLNIEPYSVRRIVIDANVNDVLIVHIEMIGSKDLLDVSFDGIDVKVKILKGSK